MEQSEHSQKIEQMDQPRETEQQDQPAQTQEPDQPVQMQEPEQPDRIQHPDQIKRIQEMEEHLDRAAAVMKELTTALEHYREAKESFRRVEYYMSSWDWIIDYQDDEEGNLPEDLKRGVLSQDAIYNLLDEEKETMVEMMEMAKDYLAGLSNTPY